MSDEWFQYIESILELVLLWYKFMLFVHSKANIENHVCFVYIHPCIDMWVLPLQVALGDSEAFNKPILLCICRDMNFMKVSLHRFFKKWRRRYSFKRRASIRGKIRNMIMESIFPFLRNLVGWCDVRPYASLLVYWSGSKSEPYAVFVITCFPWSYDFIYYKIFIRKQSKMLSAESPWYNLCISESKTERCRAISCLFFENVFFRDHVIPCIFQNKELPFFWKIRAIVYWLEDAVIWSWIFLFYWYTEEYACWTPSAP